MNEVTQDSLAKARSAAKALGISPRKRGEEKLKNACIWIYRWGWSYASAVDLIANTGRRGIVTNLKKRGLIEIHPTPAGRGMKYMPDSVITLTQDGVSIAEAFIDGDFTQIIPYPKDGAKLIKWGQLRHDAIVQHLTAEQVAHHGLCVYVTVRELESSAKPGEKIPDAIWNFADADIAVELELTAKKESEMHRAILSMIESKSQYDEIRIYSHSPAILRRWENMVKPGEKIPRYQKDAGRRWVKSLGIAEVPPALSGKMHFELLEL